jgi:hypothetical protein
MINHPNLEPIDPRRYTVEDEWVHEYVLKGYTYRQTTNVGYITDGASIPRFLWVIQRPEGLMIGPSVIHDGLYGLYGKREHQKPNIKLELKVGGTWLDISNEATPRSFCDDVFKIVMIQAGIHPVKRGLIYNSVRLFGGFYF